MNPYFDKRFTIDACFAGLYSAVWGLGIGAGGILGGKMTDKLGQRQSVLYAMLLSLVSIVLFLVVPNPTVAFIIALVFGFAFGFYETVYFATAMARTDPRIAASMFSILMAIANIGTGIGLAVTGLMVDSVGYPWTFIIIAGLNLFALPLIPTVFQRKASQN